MYIYYIYIHLCIFIYKYIYIYIYPSLYPFLGQPLKRPLDHCHPMSKVQGHQLHPALRRNGLKGAETVLKGLPAADGDGWGKWLSDLLDKNIAIILYLNDLL